MSSALETLLLTTSAPETDQCVELRDIGWNGYRQMVRLRGDRRVPRRIYLHGNLELTSPSCPHEHGVYRLERFITVITEEYRIPCVGTRSTTFRRRRKKGGVEPDLSYDFTNALRIRDNTRINLRTNPPPDLAVKVVCSRDASRTIEVYRRFGVPEVWIWEHPNLLILALDENVQYAESPTSLAFPFLSAPDIATWIARPESETETDTDWALQLRQWVRDILVPRSQIPEPETIALRPPESPNSTFSRIFPDQPEFQDAFQRDS